MGQIVPKKCARKLGVNVAGPAAPLGGGRSDCPLVLELLLGRLNADPIKYKFHFPAI